MCVDCHVCRGEGARPNPFLERAIEVALMAASSANPRVAALLAATGGVGASIVLTLQADNDFYSQTDHLAERGLPRTAAGLRALPRFLPCPKGGCCGGWGTLCEFPVVIVACVKVLVQHCVWAVCQCPLGSYILPLLCRCEWERGGVQDRHGQLSGPRDVTLCCRPGCTRRRRAPTHA